MEPEALELVGLVIGLFFFGLLVVNAILWAQVWEIRDLLCRILDAPSWFPAEPVQGQRDGRMRGRPLAAVTVAIRKRVRGAVAQSTVAPLPVALAVTWEARTVVVVAAAETATSVVAVVAVETEAPQGTTVAVAAAVRHTSTLH